jgi:hypothetical protein
MVSAWGGMTVKSIVTIAAVLSLVANFEIALAKPDGSNSGELTSEQITKAAKAAARRVAKKELRDYRQKAKSLLAGVTKAMHSVTDATNANYSKNYFKSLSNINVSAKDTAEMSFAAYDLASNAGILDLDEIQQEVAMVRKSMENAEELITTKEEGGDALDIAALRCSQTSGEDAVSDLIATYLDKNHVKTYQAAKREVCTVVLTLADLRYKREQYEALKENGYPLFYKHKKDKKSFSGYERTVQYKVDLRFYPGDQDFLAGDFEHGNFEFIHAFKWSDNDWGDNNLREAFADDSKDDLICLPFIKISNNAEADLCFQVKSVTSTEVKVYTKAKFKYKDDKKSIEIGTVTVPAPFGYMADLSDMKESAMQNLESTVKSKIEAFLPVDNDLLTALQEI